MNRITGGGGGTGNAATDYPAGGRREALAMLLGETVAVALQSIRANMLRSVLTMLGIIIGVGAVITMVALGSGAQKAVQDRIAALGANVFTVYRRSGAPGRDQNHRSDHPEHRRLRCAPARCAPLLKAVVPEMQQSLQVKYGNQNSNVNVVGTTSELHRRAKLHGSLRPHVHPGRG